MTSKGVPETKTDWPTDRQLYHHHHQQQTNDLGNGKGKGKAILILQYNRVRVTCPFLTTIFVTHLK
jgi:hypothetical protein